MMTKISDYLISAPPSDTDITGNIIPVADIEGKDALLRKEDFYYLRELWNAYNNDIRQYNLDFGQSGASLLTLIGQIINTLNEDKSLTYMTPATHMKAGLASYAFTGSISTGSAVDKQFFNWMKNANAIVTLDGSPISPTHGGKIDADAVRYFYRFLTQDMFRQVNDTSRTGTRAFTFTTETKSVPYSYPKLDSSNNLEFVQMTGQIKGASGTVTVDGISGNGQQIGMHSLQRYNSSSRAYEYYNSVAFPSATTTADITFSSPVVEAYAQITLYVSSRTGQFSQGLQLLRPMTGSGVNWSVDLLKRSDYDLVTANMTVPALDAWVGTGATETYFSATIERVFARFANPYFALPSEWNWSPS